jgi:hypothetical protein
LTCPRTEGFLDDEVAFVISVIGWAIGRKTADRRRKTANILMKISDTLV